VALSKKNEQEADLTSASWSPDSAHGGAYLFHLIKEQQKESRKHSLAARLLFSSEGHNRLLYFSHPTETQRICYLATPLGKSAASPSSTHLSSGLVTQLASQ
jgi:hypothetical protein